MTNPVTAATFILLAFGIASSEASEFECPQLGDLKTSPLVDIIDSLVPKGQELAQPEVLASSIALLREHGLSTDDAVNHLIALYCPAVAAERDLSQDEITDRIRQFAKKAASLALTMSGEDDIVYGVSLNPTIAEEARVRANQAGLSVEKWIAQVVEAAMH